MTDSQMHLALLMGGTGSHVGAYRMPGAVYGPDDFSLFAKLAQQAEAAKFDLIFMADGPFAAKGPTQGRVLEVITTLAALASATKRIGLVGTVSTSYFEPYNLARQMGSLDRISGGRAGWNVVTTSVPEAALNFGNKQQADKAERYAQASEFVKVVKGLWDSWEDDSIVDDRQAGILYDQSKRYVLDHNGKYFSVKGPLDQGRPPQGYPVIFQAGASEVGIPFAAEIGEVIFTVQESLEVTKAFRERIRKLAAENGRDPELVLVIPGICPFVAETEEKARQMLWDLSQGIDEAAAWETLSIRMGMNVRHLDPEGPLPEIPWDQMRGHAKTLSAVAKNNNFNLRQVRDYAAAAAGHRLIFGTPEMVANDLETWFSAGACDGFMILPPYLPGPLNAFCTEVVPILQQRGLFRTEYDRDTLRGHLGLSRPDHPAARNRVRQVG
jgi:FMN-dependent oxidoreductase (nitrilotriacetate monooxygenase family)